MSNEKIYEKNSIFVELNDIKDIRFLESHEKVLSEENWSGNDDNLNLKTSIGLAKNDPVINGDLFTLHPRYEMTFSENDQEFFKAAYILAFTVKSKDVAKTKEMLDDGNMLTFFVGKQLHHIVWPILRSRIINACANLSLKPIILPWTKPIKASN